MHGDTGRRRAQGMVARVAMVGVAFALTACGVGGGDEATEVVVTATSQPAVTEATTGVVSEQSSPESDSTPASDGGTPPVSASPTPEMVVSSPRIAVPTAAPTMAIPAPQNADASPVASGTPVPAGDTQVDVVGDGTGGAVPGNVGEGSEADLGTPQASDGDDATVVSSCDVGFYPPYAGDAAAQVTTSEVNFRSGPGTDCDPIGEPLPAETNVEILSAPVVREGEDGFVWVAVLVDGDEGWLATEFLEPAAGE